MVRFKGKIAAHAITWGAEDLLALEELSKLGFRAVEPWPRFALRYEDRVEELKELLERHKLVVASLYGGASGEPGRKFGDPAKREDIVAYNVRLAKLLSMLGATELVLGPGAPREAPTTPVELKQAAATINATAKATLEYGVKSCVHPHLWTELQDENELDTLMELCDPACVFLAPDTAHLTNVANGLD